MGVFRLCFVSFLAAAAVTAGDLNVLTGVRIDTPWGHLLLGASDAAGKGDYIRSAQLYESALHAISGTSREDRLEYAVAANGLGTAYAREGRYPEAEPLFQQSLAIWRQYLGSRSIMIAVVLNNIADIHTARGKYEDARRCQAEALKIDEETLGPQAPLVANDWNNLGVTYSLQHKYSAAERALRHAIELGSSAVPPNPRLSEFTGNLASLLMMLRRVEESENLQNRVLSMQVEQRGRSHASVGLTLVHIADCEIKMKKYGSAIGHAAQAIRILKARLGDRHPRTASAYFTLALAYERMKRVDLAEPVIEYVVEIDKAATLDPIARTAHLKEYAIVMRERGKREEARAAEDEAAQITPTPDQAAAHETVDVRELAGR